MKGRIGGMHFYLFNARLGPAWFIRGVNYWRYVEYPWVINNLALSPGCKVLDIGSASHSLLPLFLASRLGCIVHATDVDDYVYTHLRTMERMGLGNLVREGKFAARKEDARALSYPDASFDRVCSVSTLEHIPGNGDREAAREIGRVLKPGGLAAITVPFHRRYYETFVSRKEMEKARFSVGLDWLSFAKVALRRDKGPRDIFESRHYDLKALEERLIKPSGLRLRKLEFFGERGFHFEALWRRTPFILKLPFRWLMPLFSTRFIHRMGEDELDKAMTACLLLEKESA